MTQILTDLGVPRRPSLAPLTKWLWHVEEGRAPWVTSNLERVVYITYLQFPLLLLFSSHLNHTTS